MNTYEVVGTAHNYGTGLVLEFDSRNAGFPVAPLLDTRVALGDKKWDIASADRENQGNTPECVGACITHELALEPIKVAVTHPHTRQNIYNWAQLNDEWAGENYAGTSLNAGMKAARHYGYITEWRWAMNLDEVLRTLHQLGPVILAGPWLTGMFTPDVSGHIMVNGTAGNIGHAYTLGEIQHSQQRVIVEQSWGPNWSRFPGPDGGWRGWLSYQDVQTLLTMGTQAAIITGRANPDAPGPTPPPPPRTKVATVNIYNLPPYAEVV